MRLDGWPQTADAQATRDQAVVAALLRGEEAAFLALVNRHHQAMIHLARLHLGNEALAEEVAQDCWVLVLRGLSRWSGCGSLRSWIFGIVVNRARSRAAREWRTVPLSTLQSDDGEGYTGAVSTGGEWLWSTDASAVDGWRPDVLERREVLAAVQTAIEGLPSRQRAVITLRDVAGCDGPEACAALCLSEGNQRVLLHRARVKVRNAVQAYLRS